MTLKLDPTTWFLRSSNGVSYIEVHSYMAPKKEWRVTLHLGGDSPAEDGMELFGAFVALLREMK